MERLITECYGEYVPKELCSIDDCDLCFEHCKVVQEYVYDCTNCGVKKCFNRLAEYENLEEQGKLLKLPCAVGDTVYRFYTVDDEIKIYEHHITTLTNIVNIIEAGEIGKTVFFTRPEAEAKLVEMEGRSDI